jgi:hypothetical protein
MMCECTAEATSAFNVDDVITACDAALARVDADWSSAIDRYVAWCVAWKKWWHDWFWRFLGYKWDNFAVEVTTRAEYYHYDDCYAERLRHQRRFGSKKDKLETIRTLAEMVKEQQATDVIVLNDTAAAMLFQLKAAEDETGAHE